MFTLVQQLNTIRNAKAKLRAEQAQRKRAAYEKKRAKLETLSKEHSKASQPPAPRLPTSPARPRLSRLWLARRVRQSCAAGFTRACIWAALLSASREREGLTCVLWNHPGAGGAAKAVQGAGTAGGEE